MPASLSPNGPANALSAHRADLGVRDLAEHPDGA
jgi:hypothetical protein